MAKKPQKQVFVKPNPKFGGLIRDPVSLQFVAKDGEWKPFNSYWMRRIKFSDVLEVDPPKKTFEYNKKDVIKNF